MTTRAKVYVESVKLLGTLEYPMEEVQMRAIAKSGAYPESGLDEDNTYAKFSPSADFRLLIANPALHGEFKPGQKRYVDISEPLKQ